MSSDDLVEIRLLGPLRVRRVDGSWVDGAEWRTRKTQDLLRILALEAGQRVSTDQLVDVLWPEGDVERGKVSLRTAASHLRRVLGPDCLTRSRGGLVLSDVWVDTQKFQTLAHDCHQAFSRGDFAAALVSAEAADSLYIRDLEPAADGTAWWVGQAQQLRTARAGLLVEAAASAISLHLVRDAADYAERAVATDAYSERACRVAMLAFRGIGEISRAMNVYNECRTRLSEELGVDPTPETQEVYLQLLRSDPPVVVEPPFVGFEAETEQLRREIVDTIEAGTNRCIVIIGSPRSGTSRWLTNTVSQLAVPVRRLDDAPDGGHLSSMLTGAVLLSDDTRSWPRDRLRAMVTPSAAPAGPGMGSVLLTAQRTGIDEAADADLADLVAMGVVQTVAVPELTLQEMDLLIEQLTGVPPTPELRDKIGRLSGRQAGLVVDIVTGWLSEGRLVHSPRGVELGAPAAADANGARAREQLAGLLDRLDALELEVLEVVAVARGATVPAIATVLSEPGHPDFDETTGDGAALSSAGRDSPAGPAHRDPAEVKAVVSRLEQLAVLTVDDPGVYQLRTPQLRDAFRAWMRPGVHRRLHRRMSLRLAMPSPDRVWHWIEAGEPQLACAAALEAAAAAMTTSDFATAYRCLIQVQDLMDPDTASPRDRIELLQRLATCAERLGSAQEADAAGTAARSLAREQGVAVLRLASDEVWSLPASVTRSPGRLTVESRSLESQAPEPQRHQLPLLRRLGITLNTGPSNEVEILLRDALLRAEARGDTEGEVEATLLLVGLVLTPRRLFAETQRALDRVDPAAAQAYRRMLQLTRFEKDVLLGDPGLDLAELEELAGGAPLVGLTSGLSPRILRAIARHDRGHQASDEAIADAIHEAEETRLGGPWRWVLARTLVQRGQVERARDLTGATPWQIGSPTAQLLAVMGRAELMFADGDRSGAAAALSRGVEVAERTGALLLLPEVASRLVILREESDRESAHEFLDLAEVAIGESTSGRERVVVMLGRAAVRAIAGRALSAAVIAGGAATLATSLGLEHTAAEATAFRTDFIVAAAEVEPDGERRKGERRQSTTQIGPEMLPNPGGMWSAGRPSDHSAHDL